MEPSGRNPSQSAANGMPAQNGSDKRKPLPWVATSCLSRSMVRMGSPVRFRRGLHQADDQRKCWSSWRSMRYLPSREHIPCWEALWAMVIRR
jgi:hypothetical protein